MIELFILDSCPYCRKVMDYMNSHGVEYVKFDITNPTTEDALVKIGGKRQVPFMIDKDRNVQMYESDDIIEYLKTIS